jgi:hypothetical protein
LAEASSEIPREIEKLRRQIKFSPRKSIRLALMETNTQLPVVTGWALARLVAWAFFDQHKTKRIPKELRTTAAAKRAFKPLYAYKAGQLYLLYHADCYFRKYEKTAHFRKISTEEAATAIHMYFETGQVRKNFGHRGKTLSALHNDKYRHRDLMFVYHVMDFLVRAKLSRRKDVCKVKIARFFVEKLNPMGEQLGASTIEKAWNRYRAAAPYIYAFYPRLYGVYSSEGAFAEAKKITEEDWISCVAQLATKSTLEECLGHAAFAADVLTGTGTRDVRIKDFERVPCVKPLLREFDVDELLIIESYDDTGPIE